MQDFAFYNTGCDDTRGAKSVLVLARRLLRRILRPFFLRQAELFQRLADQLGEHEHRIFAQKVDVEAVKTRQAEHKDRMDQMMKYHDILAGRQDELADQIQTTMAFGWDYVAFVRRLGTLEDQIAMLTGTAAGATGNDEGDIHPSILFPGLEKATRRQLNENAGDDDDAEPRSKVC